MECWDSNPVFCMEGKCPAHYAAIPVPEIIYFFLFLGSHPAMHRGYSWLCTQELLLAVLRGQYGMLGIKLGLAVYKANTLPTVLLLQPQDRLFLRVSPPQLPFGSMLKSHQVILGYQMAPGIKSEVPTCKACFPILCIVACLHWTLLGL